MRVQSYLSQIGYVTREVYDLIHLQGGAEKMIGPAPVVAMSISHSELHAICVIVLNQGLQIITQ